MKIASFSLLSVLVIGAVATSQASSGGYAAPPDLYPDADIAYAEEYLNRIANERRSIRNNLDAFKQQNRAMLNFLTLANEQLFPHLSDAQKEQTDRLSSARDQIKDVLHTLGPLESKLSGEKVLAKRQEGQILNTWINIDVLMTSNVLLTASLANSEVFLEEAKEKLNEKLNTSKIFAEDKIVELSANTVTASRLIHSKRCFATAIYVPVDADTAEGSSEEDFNDHFDDSIVPTVYCALEGFVSKVSLGQSQSYSPYGSPTDEFQNLAMSLNCQGFTDRVRVEVFDQSRGDGNAVVGAYVAVKVCTFSAQAIVPY